MSSDNQVSDKVELHLIDTRQLVEEAKKLREAQRIADADKKLKKSKSLPSTGTGPLSRLDPDAKSSVSSIGAPIGATNVPKGFFTGGDQTFKSAVGGARTDNAFTEAQRKQQELEAKVKSFEDKIKELDKKSKAMQEKLIGSINNVQSVLSPVAYGANLRSLTISKLGSYGIIGSLILATVTETISEVEKQFGPGGVWDTRLKVPPQATTLNNVDNQNAFKAGTRYITSDLRVQQKSPQTSNTSNLSFESIRYAMDNLGRS